MVPTQGEGMTVFNECFNASLPVQVWQCDDERSCSFMMLGSCQTKTELWWALPSHLRACNSTLPEMFTPTTLHATDRPLPRLHASLEGHVQSARLWAQHNNAVLIDKLTAFSLLGAALSVIIFCTFVCMDGIACICYVIEFIRQIPDHIVTACTCFLHDTDNALMLTGEESLGDWDARKYPKCRPFMGEKGVPWENFKRDFGAAMSSIHIQGDADDNDLEQTMLGWDNAGENQQRQSLIDYNSRIANMRAYNPNVPVPPPPLPPDNAEMNRHRRRNKTLYAHIYSHIADLRLREMLSAMCPRDGRRAFMYLEQQCARQITDLELFAHDKEWQDASIIGSIGVKLDSITMFTRYLNGLNARRPAASRKNNDELTLKLLSCITNHLSPTLAMEAAKELRHPPHLRQFTIPGTVQRDFGAAVQYFDEFWRAQFESGAIRPSPRRGSDANTGRVDNAAYVDGDADGDDALISGATNRPVLSRDELRLEPLCWNCRGFGHVRDKCPSVSALRPVGAVIDMLRGSLRTGGFQKGKGKGKGSGRGRGRGGGGRGRGYNYGSSLVADADGYVYDDDGNCVGSYSEPEPEPVPEPTIDATEQEPDESYVAWDDDDMLVAGSDDGEDTGYESDNSAESLEADAAPSPDSDTESMPSLNVKSYSETADPHAKSRAVHAPFAKPSANDPAATAKWTDAADAEIAAASRASADDESAPAKWYTQIYNHGRWVIIMLVIGLFTMLTAELSPTGCSALVLAGSVPRSSLLLPIDSALPAWTDKTINKMFDRNANNGDLVVDCGATKHCLPHEACLLRVTDRNPAHGGVRIGSGKLLPVSAIGEAAIPVATVTKVTRKGKSRIVRGVETLLLTNVLIVKGMPCQLFSSRWGFEHDGVRTYLNDDKYLRLPSGSRVEFKDTKKHYVVGRADEALVASTDDLDADLFHCQLAHANAARIALAAHRFKIPYNIAAHDPSSCDACKLNKRKRNTPKATTISVEYKYFGQRVCSDISGPKANSPQGYRYVINFYDCFTKVVDTYFLKSTSASDIIRATESYIADHKYDLRHCKTPGTPDEWFTDEGSGYAAEETEKFCLNLGTKHNFSPAHEPTRNANAERAFGTLGRAARIIIAHAGNSELCESLWPFAYNQAALIHNSLPTKGHNPPKAPFEVLHNDAIDLAKFHVMFCDCYVKLDKSDLPSKLASTRIKAMYCGWSPRHSAHFVYIEEISRMTTCIDIEFAERSFTKASVGAKMPKLKMQMRSGRALNTPIAIATPPTPPIAAIAQQPPSAPPLAPTTRSPPPINAPRTSQTSPSGAGTSDS